MNGSRNSTLPVAWLFDIDGTLLLTEGASREAFSSAVCDQFGLETDLAQVPFAGRTEPLILADVLAAVGRRFENGGEARFWDSVLSHMSRLLKAPRGRLLPGVIDLLDALDARPEWPVGLLTGNMTDMARIKLEHFGIRERFGFGAFGEEAADRNALAMVAVGRVAARYGVPASRCIVVGDTEHDIACARAAGARVVAVATGGRTEGELAAFAPDLVLPDLRGFGAVIEWAAQIT